MKAGHTERKKPRKVAIIQSNYVPWKGYFDIINDADLFVFYDDVQFTKNDWRNRNKLKTPNGLSWITIPVGQNLNRLICEVRLENNSWMDKHLKTFRQYYSAAPYFRPVMDWLEDILLGRKWTHLSDLNHCIIKGICKEFLGVKTEFIDSREHNPCGKRLDRVIDLLTKIGTHTYISGPSARGYIDENAFSSAGIDLVYKDYSGYPEYPQFHPPFEHYVSVLDTLANCGPESASFIWGWRGNSTQRIGRSLIPASASGRD